MRTYTINEVAPGARGHMHALLYSSVVLLHARWGGILSYFFALADGIVQQLAEWLNALFLRERVVVMPGAIGLLLPVQAILQATPVYTRANHTHTHTYGIAHAHAARRVR